MSGRDATHDDPPPDHVMRYRHCWGVRWGVPLGMLLYVPAWIAASARYDSFADLPWCFTIWAAALTLAVAVAWRAVVTVTQDHLIIRTFVAARVLAWADILSIDVSDQRVMATTRAGTFRLPVSARRMVMYGGARRSLRDAVAAAWLVRRGSNWFAAPLEPWAPPYDVHGNVVLRVTVWRRLVVVAPRLGTMAVFLLAFPLSYSATTTWPSGVGPVGMYVIAFGGTVLLLATVIAAHAAWARFIVGPDDILVRSLTFGRHRIPRDRIVGFSEGPRAMSLGPGYWTLGSKPSRGGQLTLWLRDGRRISLPAPLTGRAYDNDPDFYRIWAWLKHELADPNLPQPDTSWAKGIPAGWFGGR